MLKVGYDGSRIEQGVDTLGCDFKRTSNDFGLRHLLYNNAQCSICHGTGAKWAFKYVTRNYASKKGKICNTLQAHEREIWICPACIENMEQLTGIRIQLPTEKPGKEKNMSEKEIEKLSEGKTLVTKETAIKAVNDVLATYIPSFRPWEERIPLDCAAKIMALPPADQQVRHCRECKWWDAEEGSNKGFCHAAKHCYMSGTWDISIYRKTDAEFFCGDAAAPDPEEEEEENEDE